MNFSVEETPDSNVCIPMPVAGTFETCRRTRSMSVFIGGHRKSSAHAQNDAIDPGCVKSPSFNLRVEHLSQFHRYGNQLHWSSHETPEHATACRDQLRVPGELTPD